MGPGAITWSWLGRGSLRIFDHFKRAMMAGRAPDEALFFQSIYVSHDRGSAES